MSKRAASYDIDEHTYEEKEKLREAGDSIDDEGQHLTNRKIYKIRKQDGTEPRAGSGNVDLKIKGFDNNDDKKAKEEIKVPQNPFKLNLFGQSQGVGLFTNVLSTTSAPSAPSLFGSKPATMDNSSKEPAKPASGPLFDFKKPQTGNLFANNSLFNSTSGSLFGNTQPSSILFGGSTNKFPSTNLFGNKLAGPITAPPENEDSGDSQELEKDQQMVADPSKSEVKFDYGAQDDIVQKVSVAKYKKDKGNLVQDVQAIIKHDSQKEIYSLIIRLASTKNIIYTGILFPQKSAVKRNKENLDILAISLNDKKYLEANRIKLQIKGQDKKLDEFYQELEKIVGNKSQENA